MLSDDKTIELWKKLSNEFNVHVRSIGVGKTANGDECTVVMVDDKTAPAVITSLPDKFANEQVQYITGGQPVAAPVGVPGCGQPGHQCACGAPKP